MNTDTCKGCGAAIIWTLSPNGARLPVDAKALPNGSYYQLEDRGEATPGAVSVPVRDLHLSHFVTCPHRAQFSRKP